MKKHLQSLFINIISLWLVSNILTGIKFAGGYKTLLLSALVLTLVNSLIKPLINLLLLPINLLTLGMFHWLVNVITLYLVQIIVPQFQISAFLFPGLNYSGFVIPRIYLSYFAALIAASFLISLINNFLVWLLK